MLGVCTPDGGGGAAGPYLCAHGASESFGGRDQRERAACSFGGLRADETQAITSLVLSSGGGLSDHCMVIESSHRAVDVIEWCRDRAILVQLVVQQLASTAMLECRAKHVLLCSERGHQNKRLIGVRSSVTYASHKAS